MHVGVAFGWSAVFLLLVTRSARIRSVLASPQGTIKVASLYGPFVWMVMSLAVIPLLAHRPPTINIRWWIQLDRTYSVRRTPDRRVDRHRARLGAG